MCGTSPDEQCSDSALDLSLARRNLMNTLAMDGMVKGIVTGDGGGVMIMFLKGVTASESRESFFLCLGGGSSVSLESKAYK